MMKKMKLFNSLTNKIEEINPIEEGKISMYVCGPTVYNSPHIGNIRPVIVFDVIRRVLKHIGYDVTYVSNFTDVDDKIINKAIDEGVTEKDISTRYINEYLYILDSLNVLPASDNPKVTNYIDDIVKYIKDLLDSNHAYVSDGDVYFSVDSIKNYGELSNINIDDLKVGARIEETGKKRSPLDFALWKKTEKGIKWDTIIGEGRPGWHTECCVMINKIFPKHLIDIHGGGFDLKFPHHENEIAQSKAHDDNKLANYWVHNGFVNIDNEKMSKSIGNVVLAKDLLAKFSGNAIRMLMLSAHYRAPLNFTDDAINNCINELTKIETAFKQLCLKLQGEGVDLLTIPLTDNDEFVNSLIDDLNVANAMTELSFTIKKINQELRSNPVNINSLTELYGQIVNMFDYLGLSIKPLVLNDDDRVVYSNYLKFKKEKNFEASDKLRQILIERHIL